MNACPYCDETKVHRHLIAIEPACAGIQHVDGKRCKRPDCPLVGASVSVTEMRIMEHATGWRHRTNPGYRNRFVAGPDHHDWTALVSLCDRGLMFVRRVPDDLMGGMTTFAVTDLGMEVLRAAP